jgi:tricarballylate dehydrogenase
MRKLEFDVVVAGCGIAGLSAAVSAAEQGARVAVLERAPIEERGGNTRYTEAYLRMKNEQEVADDFETHFAENAGGHLDPSLVKEAAGAYDSWSSIVKSLGFADPELINTFATAVPPTIKWLKDFGIRFEALPTPFLTRNAPKLMPVGGGLALIEALVAQAEKRNVEFFYQTTATDLALDASRSVAGIEASSRILGPLRIFSHACVLACGGFEGNPEMLTQYLGPQALYLRPVARGGYYNKGEGIRMALRANAAACGDYGNYHAEPMDPRSGITEPAIFIFPYGILVNQCGRRFTDEAPGTVDASYERITRQIPHQPGGIAYALLDRKVTAIPNYRVAVRSDQPPIEAGSLDEMAAKLDIAPLALRETVAAYNAACVSGRFDPFALDNLSTQALDPPKSNWARPIDEPPFMAYPMVAGNVFTFGGLKVNGLAQVLDNDGMPIPGLHAAGEVIGIYYKAYTGATSVLRGAVFGKIAGAAAAQCKKQ